MVIQIDKLTLEGRLSPEVVDTLRAVCSAGWDPVFAATPEGKSACDEVIFRRHDQTVRRILPWIEHHIDFASSKIIDFGAGCGSSALAFSKVALKVHSFEINGVSCDAFRKRMEIFDVHNVEFTQCPPETIFERAADAITPSTSVMLVAVVEHLLEAEQVLYLKTFWDNLAPGRILAIMETPNYLSYFDTHTFQKPFSHYIPDAMFSGWLKRQPSSMRFRKELLEDECNRGGSALAEQRRRIGLGVTSEPFEQAFGSDLNELVVGDGFDDEMMAWFPLAFDDQILLSTFNHYKIQLPIGFAKNVLSFVFKKPENISQANSVKSWNEHRRHEVIQKYAAKIG